MKLLDRYIIFEIFSPFVSLLSIFILLIFLGNLSDFIELIVNKGVGLLLTLELIILFIPQFIGFLVPVTLFFSIVVAMVRFSSDREIDALKSSGISLYRLAMPIVLFSLTCWVFSSYAMLIIAPQSYEGFKKLSLEIIQNRATIGLKAKSFNEVLKGLVLYSEEIDSKGKLKNILISDSRDPENKKIIFAKKGSISPDNRTTEIALNLSDGTIHMRGEMAQGYKMIEFSSFKLQLDLLKRFKDKKFNSQRMMSVAELKEMIKSYSGDDKKYNSIMISIHQKYAIPFLCVVFGILGIPFGVIFHRSSREPGYIICITLMLLYFIVFMAGKRIGEEGVIGPIFATWMPNVIFLVIGVYLFYRVANDKSSWILESSQKISLFIEKFNKKIIGKKEP